MFRIILFVFFQNENVESPDMHSPYFVCIVIIEIVIYVFIYMKSVTDYIFSLVHQLFINVRLLMSRELDPS